MEEIADLKLQIITPQSSAPIIAIQQDQLLGTWNLSQEYYPIDWRTTMNLLSGLELDKFNAIPKNKKYEGKEIYSYLIPDKINLLKGDPSNPKIYVLNGIMKGGLLGDDSVGVKKKNSLVQLVWDEYGVDITKKFIDNTTRLATDFNMYHGMSMGIGDLYIPDELYQQLVQNSATKKLELQHEITELENNPDMMTEDLFETSANSNLAVVRDDAYKSISAHTTRKNNFITMMDSGAKGKSINLAQLVGCVGQQAFQGGRMLKNYNSRTLPYYFKNDDRAEARGFIERPLVRGIRLPEFIFLHLAAREGLIDTTVRSVTPDTKIVIMENSKPKVVEIGSWIDSQIDPINITNPELIERDKNNFELLKVKQIQIPTVDSVGNVSWGEVTAITRHDPGLQLYEIVTRGGRKVTVPESKSLLIWNSQTEHFEEKLTPDVVLGDCVPVTMNLSLPPVVQTQIDMTEYFPKTEYIYGTDFIRAQNEMEKAMEGRDKIPSGWWERSNGTLFTLPYTKKSLFQRTQVRSNNDNVREGYLYPYGAKKENVLIPEKFELNRTNGQFIGLFLADGNVDFESGYIQITKSDESTLKFVEKYFDSLNISHKINKRITDRGTIDDIRGYSRLFGKFLDTICGHGAINKKIPEFAYNAPDEFVIGLIDGFISGDGCIQKTNTIQASSISKTLIDGINYLLSRLGIFAKVSEYIYDNTNRDIKANYNNNIIDIRAQWVQKFKLKIKTLLNSEKNVKLQNIKVSEFNSYSYKEQKDVVLDEIKEINIVPVSKYKKLYDLTIPSTLNFMLFNGMGVRDTAESGYVQRKLIKATEDMMVNYDGTVRNAVGRILQFQYGDSGADTVKQYEYNFKLMEMGNEEINSKYGMGKEELAKVKGWTKTDNDEFVKGIKHIRNKLRGTQIKTTLNYLTLTTTYFLPVNLNRILDNYRNDESLKGTVCTEPKYILDMIADILEPNNTRLYAMTEDEIKNKKSVKYRDDQVAKTAFGYAMTDLFAPRKCIFQYKLSKAQLDGIKKEIIKSFNRSIVEPGEMVGIIAAQSLGEPVTQLMLKSFHSSGIGGKGGTDIGVDTIKEVFSLSKNPKAPSMEIYFEKEYRTKKDYTNKIASYIKFTTIKDLKSKMEIFYEPEPDDFDGFIVKDNVGEPFYTYQPNKQCCSNTTAGLPWLLRIEFDKEKLMSKEVTLLDIKSQFCFAWEKRYTDVKGMKREKKQLIDKITQIAVQSNTDNDDVPVIHIRFDMTNFTQTTLIDFMDIFVDEFKLKGMPGIDDVNSGKAFEERILSFDSPDSSMEKNSEYVIYTKGINMEVIKNIVGVDLNRTYCNDILTIYENFGIEAARNYIIRRIIVVLTSNGSGTNYQHIEIFGDLMTQVGTLTSIDRHGLNKLDNDPLSRASFEKTVDQLITAAIFNEVDYMKSVSSRIMAGLCIKGGTGLCNLILDKEMLENSEYTTDIGQLYNKTYKDITSNLQTQEVDDDVFIPEM